MNSYILTHPSFEQFAVQEIKEILGKKAVQHSSVVEFSGSKEECITALFHLQSARRLLLAIGKYGSVDTLNVEKTAFPWTDIFSSAATIKVEVEGVKGQDNRAVIARNVSGKLLSLLEQKYNLTPKIELRRPDIVIIVFFNGENYFLGVDLAGDELNSREYRLFPHSASLKGDAAYVLVRKTGFAAGKKILIGFMKDGTMAVEAALFANRKPLFPVTKPLSFQKFLLFQKMISDKYILAAPEKTIIHGFDEALPNVLASRKNAALAGVKEIVDLQKMTLDELDVKFTEQEFDSLLFIITAKDEIKINELYYQADYVLKSKGKCLIVGRSQWELPLSSKFKLLEKGVLERGESKHLLWLLEKK